MNAKGILLMIKTVNTVQQDIKNAICNDTNCL